MPANVQPHGMKLDLSLSRSERSFRTWVHVLWFLCCARTTESKSRSTCALITWPVSATYVLCRDYLAQAFKLVEPEAVHRRKQRRFKRKRFWSAGVMDILCFDQHDKWKSYGLWLHLGMDPFSVRIAWFRIWWTNRNGRLVTSYFIDACRVIGGASPANALWIFH